MGKVKDLQVEMGSTFFYHFKVSDALCSEAAVREVKFLEQRGRLRCSNSLHNC